MTTNLEEDGIDYSSSNTSHSLFDILPDELVDCICRHARRTIVLPSSCGSRSTWFCEPSSRHLLEIRFPQPTTFLALRLVCKRLNRIATQYVWETMDVQLRHRSKDECLSHAEKPGRLKRSRNTVDILEHLVLNSHLASMVRVLCLRVSGYAFAASPKDESEYDLQSDLGQCIERLLATTKALTAFSIDNADLLTPRAASMLLSCKSLRLIDLGTLGFQGDGLQLFSGQDLPHLEYFGLSVFNLVHRSLMLPRSLKRASLHCDSMSAFVREEAPSSDLQICFATIEELAIYDKHGDMALFISRHFANARPDGLVLKELFLDLEWCYTSHLSKILSNFQCPSLETLTIRNLHHMAPRGLCDIAEYFPNVRELMLSSSTADIVPAWIIGCFHEYVDALKNLENLETLEWDNSALCLFTKETEEAFGACGASLASLVKLPRLKTTRMISFSSRCVTTCRIQRDVRGQYEGYEVHKTNVFPDFETIQRLITSLYKSGMAGDEAK